ncbi:PAS domain S-box-containing protein [Thermosporothrix hazakensis]|jgi:transcriptional regulator of acetoin/glycerol metabolism|uniref:PAS domain S-box-containing protein n=1 Tax=Thermosporothrix hazakensis TaxID=644383 RepID=A0A326U760_THEHA|nr:sigma 54-interacting transcriptional regulator [Thermosporothrix hazakensis]PZW30623.1 PAS domain S-box-containing protein [Thermosporothrix hazakensis]GCE49486.1 sigma-54-dependent Fis family transcriptional regulator [Thermosporothrix hazakensis]
MQGNVQDYQPIWQQFIACGEMAEDVLPHVVQLSWRRCAAMGVDPYLSMGVNASMYPASHQEQGEGQALLSLVRPALEDLYQFIEGSGCVVAFADTEARIVDVVGDEELLQELRQRGLFNEQSWKEEILGTNALALALLESFPIQVSGAQHFCSLLHPFYSSAAPVHTVLGQAVGVLAVIGPRQCSHIHTLGMVTAAAQAISNQLQMQSWLTNTNTLLSELRTILRTLADGILLIRDDGIISQMNAPAGMMLGLIPERVMGRKLQDVLHVPPVLARALHPGGSLLDEEIVFETVRGRTPFLCTLKRITGNTGKPVISSRSDVGWLMLEEPVQADGFMLILRSIEGVQKLVHRMTGARAHMTFANLIGESSALREAVRHAQIASHSNATVLLHGETGTGKEIFAQSIHNASARADGPFVAINCAAIPRELITTELFGYEGGAFTGADRQGRPGKFELAHRGTLFLDEIGDMPLELQTSLLRTLETRTIMRIGGQRIISVDVRIIAATHKDLRAEVEKGNFRSDLYYRLNVLSIEIPPLRQRERDIPLLVQYFLSRQSRVLGRSLMIEQEALERLCAYSWPGNVRELENTLERTTYLAQHSVITVADLPPFFRHLETTQKNDNGQKETIPAEEEHAKIVGHSLKERSHEAEIEAIVQAWRRCEGNATRAAAALGISRTTLWRKMVKYGLTPEKLRASM